MSKIPIDNKLLSEIIGLSNEQIYLFESDTLKCCFANQMAQKNSDYSKEKITALTATDIYAEYDKKSLKKLIAPLLDGERSEISFCSHIQRQMGVVYPAETKLKLIEEENEKLILAINKDISRVWYKVKKLNRQRSLSEKYINKNKQKANFLSNAAHDMRTTINSIILANKLLLSNKNGDLKGRVKKFTNAIHYSGNHLLNYIDEFFEGHEKKENPKEISVECINIKSFGKQLYQMFEPLANKNSIDFNYNISDLSCRGISTNPTYLERILKNLLSNAFKYTPEGQVILNIYSPDNDELNRISFNTSRAVAFQVQDTGIGIPKSKQNKIFDRYSRVNGSAKTADGSGLGLNICKQLAVVLDGQLDMDSSKDIGTTFTLYLPDSNASDEEQISINGISTVADSQNSYGSKPDTTILIVDDNQTHNEAIQEYLQYTFDKCLTAESKNEAYRKLKKKSVDCIILDFIISGSNSTNILHQLRNSEKHAEMPIIIYTGKKLNDEEQQHLNSHADAIVKKSANSHEKLVSTIHSYLGKREQE